MIFYKMLFIHSLYKPGIFGDLKTTVSTLPL